MIKSNLIGILRACDKKELRELRKWLASPAHNQREDVIRLFEYLIEDDHLYKDDFLAKPTIFRWIHPKMEYNDAKLRQTVFFFTKALEDFLIYQEINHDQIRAKTILARVYRKKKLDKCFEKNMRVLKQVQQKHDHRNSSFLQNEYLFQQELYLYQSDFKRISLNLQEVSDALDMTYLADKLRQNCFMLAHQTVYKRDYEIGLLDEVLKYVETKDFLRIPAVAIYYYGYKATTEKDKPEYFQHLKKEIFANDHLFPVAESRDIYLMAINYCIGKINAGESSYTKELFDLYRQGFETNIWVENQQVSRWTFLNAVRAAIYRKELDWIDQFIKNFEGYIEERYREGVVHYSLAQLYYEKKDFENARKYLVQSDSDDLIVNLRARSLLLKLYYEYAEFDALESLLESMRNYLVRKKVMGYHKSNFKNIIRLTRKLLKVNPYNRTHRRKLREEIKTASPLTDGDRNWLLKQEEQLQG